MQWLKHVRIKYAGPRVGQEQQQQQQQQSQEPENSQSRRRSSTSVKSHEKDIEELRQLLLELYPARHPSKLQQQHVLRVIQLPGTADGKPSYICQPVLPKQHYHQQLQYQYQRPQPQPQLLIDHRDYQQQQQQRYYQQRLILGQPLLLWLSPLAMLCCGRRKVYAGACLLGWKLDGWPGLG
ncbi:hypothetical protein TKK_0005378 [Trichogramma kaykai]